MRVGFFIPSLCCCVGGWVCQLGFMTEIRTETRGSAVVNRVFDSYEHSAGTIDSLFRGKLISMEQGSATAYALNMLEERGVLFIEPGPQAASPHPS